jgi:Ni/Co efflux regulator RcnB
MVPARRHAKGRKKLSLTTPFRRGSAAGRDCALEGRGHLNSAGSARATNEGDENMKRLLLTIAAVASVAGPMALAATDAAAQSRDRGGWDHDRGGNRDGRHDDRRGGDYGRHDGRGDGRYDGRGDGRGDGRWDGGRHNGYYYNNRWSYGPPPAAYYGRPGFRPGYTSWRRGAYLPGYYRDRGYVVNDYYRYNLRAPPRGYYWYRTGNDYVLAAIATGLIFDVIGGR